MVLFLNFQRWFWHLYSIKGQWMVPISSWWKSTLKIYINSHLLYHGVSWNWCNTFVLINLQHACTCSYKYGREIIDCSQETLVRECPVENDSLESGCEVNWSWICDTEWADMKWISVSLDHTLYKIHQSIQDF